LGVRGFAAAIVGAQAAALVGALTVGGGRWVTEVVDLAAALTRSLRGLQLRGLQKVICDPGGCA
ncbi:MAG: hypothetical protein ACXV0U_04040, partial [Kineosporiaceae bacterium]